jgi:outer membrane protein TolC
MKTVRRSMMATVAAIGLLRGPDPSSAAGPTTVPASDLARIRQAELDTLKRAVDLAEQLYARGLADDVNWDRYSRELLETRLRFAETDADRLAVLHDGLTAARAREQLTRSRFKAGLCSDLDVAGAELARLQVEERLAVMAGK